MELCEKNICTGCFACKNICPMDAIYVERDQLGKTIPIIDKSKCIECGLCRKTCPQLQTSDFNYPQNCYAAWTKIEEDKETCASGGIATALSKAIIENNGVVFGSAYDQYLNLNVQIAEKFEELEKFKGSKYVQSDTKDSYKIVKEQLEKGIKVLYIGTPCQIDGLKHFIGKQDNELYTVDIICHGVPPMEYLKQYIASMFPMHNVTDVEFRGKNDFIISVYENDSLIYCKPSYEDLYYESFLQALSYRDNCYLCKYAQNKRVADITIGDFWGLDKDSLKEEYTGKISVILSNTEKGQKLLKMSNKYIVSEKRDVQEAFRANEQLNVPSKQHRSRAKFCKNYKLGIKCAFMKTDIGRKIRIRNNKLIKKIILMKNRK